MPTSAAAGRPGTFARKKQPNQGGSRRAKAAAQTPIISSLPDQDHLPRPQGPVEPGVYVCTKCATLPIWWADKDKAKVEQHCESKRCRGWHNKDDHIAIAAPWPGSMIDYKTRTILRFLESSPDKDVGVLDGCPAEPTYDPAQTIKRIECRLARMLLMCANRMGSSTSSASTREWALPVEAAGGGQELTFAPKVSRHNTMNDVGNLAKLCRCGRDLAACGACGAGWAQRGVQSGLAPMPTRPSARQNMADQQETADAPTVDETRDWVTMGQLERLSGLTRKENAEMAMTLESRPHHHPAVAAQGVLQYLWSERKDKIAGGREGGHPR